MAINTTRGIVRFLDRYGHLRHSFGKEQKELRKPLDQYKLTDPEIERGLASYQSLLSVPLEEKSLEIHRRPASHDGDIGPATRAVINMPRCGREDYGPEVGAAVGTGGWKRCHGVGEFHAAKVFIDASKMPSHLKPVFDQVWANVVAANAEIGILFIRTMNKAEADITLEWVTKRTGWIGLALIGPGDCKGRKLWQQFQAAYNYGDTINAWSILMLHEGGHNQGLQHSRGGIMNPSIQPRLRPTWRGDTSESIMVRAYGGVRVPLPPDVAKEYWVSHGMRSSRGREVWLPLPRPILIEAA